MGCHDLAALPQERSSDTACGLSELHRSEVAVDEHAILGLEVELASLLGLKLDGEELVATFVK